MFHRGTHQTGIIRTKEDKKLIYDLTILFQDFALLMNAFFSLGFLVLLSSIEA